MTVNLMEISDIAHTINTSWQTATPYLEPKIPPRPVIARPPPLPEPAPFPTAYWRPYFSIASSPNPPFAPNLTDYPFNTDWIWAEPYGLPVTPLFYPWLFSPVSAAYQGPIVSPYKCANWPTTSYDAAARGVAVPFSEEAFYRDYNPYIRAVYVVIPLTSNFAVTAVANTNPDTVSDNVDTATSKTISNREARRQAYVNFVANNSNKTTSTTSTATSTVTSTATSTVTSTATPTATTPATAVKSDIKSEPKPEKKPTFVASLRKNANNFFNTDNESTLEAVTGAVATTRAVNRDFRLSDPWGAVRVGDTIWVCNSNAGSVTSYNRFGEPRAASFNLILPNNADNNTNQLAEPTGIVANGNTSAFVIKSRANNRSAELIVATRNGLIYAWTPALDATQARIMIDNSSEGSAYTSLALARNRLYVTDFAKGRIVVYDREWQVVNGYAFVDEASTDPIPNNYACYSIAKLASTDGERRRARRDNCARKGEMQTDDNACPTPRRCQTQTQMSNSASETVDTNLDIYLYVAYAQSDSTNPRDEVVGDGRGYISAFKLDGTFIRRVASRGPLNTPWGMVLAPDCYGYPPATVLVANFGSGKISVLAPRNFVAQPKTRRGRVVDFLTLDLDLGYMRDRFGADLIIPGIRALFSRPVTSGPVYWTASTNNFRDYYLGTVDAANCNLPVYVGYQGCGRAAPAVIGPLGSPATTIPIVGCDVTGSCQSVASPDLPV